MITISNIAGGDARRFRATVEDGSIVDVSAAAIRHASRQGWMGYTCSDPDADRVINQYIADAEEQSWP
jgi:hypothetical protein